MALGSLVEGVSVVSELFVDPAGVSAVVAVQKAAIIEAERGVEDAASRLEHSLLDKDGAAVVAFVESAGLHRRLSAAACDGLTRLCSFLEGSAAQMSLQDARMSQIMSVPR